MTPFHPRAFLLAHQTQISGEVGGTHHIEPNDTPRAGETATTWFALVQAGGQPIPLPDCDCTLAIYPASLGASRQAASGRSAEGAAEVETEVETMEAIATPTLRAIDVEGQTDVPAADVTFPAVGAYELVLSGRPQGAATFSAFELRFPVTVATGKAATGKAATGKDAARAAAVAETGENSTLAEADATKSGNTSSNTGGAEGSAETSPSISEGSWVRESNFGAIALGSVFLLLVTLLAASLLLKGRQRG